MNFKAHETDKKLRGGYYTPLDLARFITEWLSIGHIGNVLEPSCGDGVFFEAVASTRSSTSANVTAFEIDTHEAQKAHSRANTLGVNANVQTGDFLDWALSKIKTGCQPFDAVCGNPPFIRYQYLPNRFQRRAQQVFTLLECNFTRHTNAWVPFVLASLSLLRPGGRLGMVLPSEIIHVTHARSLRTYLAATCRRIVIIDPTRLWFRETLQGAVILLAEKRNSSSDRSEGISIVPVNDREFITQNPEDLFRRAKTTTPNSLNGKWTRSLLDSSSRDLLTTIEDNSRIRRFSDIAEVDVGIVTGANKFFLVSKSIVDQYGLHDHTYPMFGRSDHCPGIIYNRRQHNANIASGKPSDFIWFKDTSVTTDKRVKAYIKLGEYQNLHMRFKCRMRSPWYSVPSVYATDIGMLKRSHDAPRLILNELRAFTTDTAYRIRSSSLPGITLVSNFLNPLTALSAELEGRHYGGGVLELVPSEIERLLVPVPPRSDIDLPALDEAVRKRSMIDVLVDNGRAVLSGVGVTKSEQIRLVDAWLALRNRRHRVSADLGQGQRGH